MSGPPAIEQPARARTLLLIAIALEVLGTLSLRMSDGFTQPVWTACVIFGYTVSLVFFARALGLGLNLGVGYGTLTGSGLMAAALASTVLFDEPIGLLDVCGLTLLLAGVLLLQRRPPVRSTPS